MSLRLTSRPLVRSTRTNRAGGDDAGLAERHREVSGHAREGPPCDGFAGVQIGNLDGARVGHIDICAAFRRHLKPFRVRGERNPHAKRALRQIDHRQTAIAIPDQHIVSVRSKPDIVGIIAETDDALHGKTVRTEQAQRAVAGAGNNEAIGGRRIEHALRFPQPGQAMYDLLLIEIDNINAAVAQLGDEQALASKIDREMIDAPRCVRQGNGGFRHKRRCVARMHRERARQRQHAGHGRPAGAFLPWLRREGHWQATPLLRIRADDLAGSIAIVVDPGSNLRVIQNGIPGQMTSRAVGRFSGTVSRPRGAPPRVVCSMMMNTCFAIALLQPYACDHALRTP